MREGVRLCGGERVVEAARESAAGSARGMGNSAAVEDSHAEAGGN